MVFTSSSLHGLTAYFPLLSFFYGGLFLHARERANNSQILKDSLLASTLYCALFSVRTVKLQICRCPRKSRLRQRRFRTQGDISHRLRLSGTRGYDSHRNRLNRVRL